MSDTEPEEVVEPESTSEEVEDSGPAARRARGSSLSGWCLPSMDADSHSRCLITVGSFRCVCTCEQHGVNARQTPAWLLQKDPE